jgi:vitamin B12 transporter
MQTDRAQLISSRPMRPPCPRSVACRLRRFFLLIAWLIALPAFAVDIEEKIEVRGKIFSQELHSKNMLIIGAEEIKTLQIRNFADLFSFFTALNVSRRGPAESSFDLSMRGSHFEQVLVMLDGVPLNNPQSGHFNTDFPFTLNDVERIEIVRGGSSTAHGAGAFAGMINIILKKKSAASVAVSGGSNGFFSGRMEWGRTAGQFNWHCGASRSNSRGYYPGREFDQIQLAGSAVYAFNKNQLEWVSGYLSKDFGADGFYEPAPSTEASQASFFLVRFQKAGERARFQLGYSRQDHRDHFILDRYQPDRFWNRSLTRSHLLFLSAARDWRCLRLASGVEWKQENLQSTSMGDFGRRQASLYLNGSIPLSQGVIDFGARGDWLATASGEFIYYAGYGHHFSGRLLGKISLSRSLRLPTFTELHYRSPQNYGNKDLRPETSVNYESSLTWFGAARTVDCSLFFRRQTDTIDWIRHDAGDPWQAVNLRKNDLLGIEMTQQWRRGRILLVTAVEKLWVLNEQDRFQSKYGLRFPDFSLKANSSFKLSKNFAVAGLYMFKRIFRTSEKGHFFNAAFSRCWRRWELSLRIENVFNTIIEEIPGIPVDGRCVYLGFIHR